MKKGRLVQSIVSRLRLPAIENFLAPFFFLRPATLKRHGAKRIDLGLFP